MTDNEKSLLDETIEYYSKNPRGVNQETLTCFYYDSKTNNKCAIGRLLSDDHAKELQYVSTNYSIDMIHEDLTDSLDYCSSELFEALSHIFNSYSVNFLSKLQQLHDTDSCWVANTSGGSDLSEYGKKSVECM